MGEPEGEKEATARFLREEFRRYYVKTKPTLPDRFGRREFGFMFWSPGMVQRHLGFAKEDELRAFLRARAPAHVYYSSAYYETPGAPTMEEKGWLGADLVFDLDADHLPDAKKMTYPEMLEAIRRKIVKLYDEFLVRDFGIEQEHLKIVFSGGRGYHIHVSDPRVWSLGSHERREIVDWIFGTDVDFDSAFKESVYDARQFQGRTYSKKRITLGTADGRTGWPGKIIRALRGLADTLEPMARGDSIEFLASFQEVSVKEAENLWDNLFKPRGSQPRQIRGVDRLRNEAQIEILTDKNVRLVMNILRQLFQVESDSYRGVSIERVKPFGETDQPVTSDIKRLIRMPSSLHGKTGLAVVALSRDALDDFRPLRDAIPSTWTDEPTHVRVANGISLEMHGETFNLGPGQQKVPQFLAIFLAARGLASLVTEV